MININSSAADSKGTESAQAAKSTVSSDRSSANLATTTAPTNSQSSTVTLSPEATYLVKADAETEKRANMSFRELQTEAHRLMDQITMSSEEDVARAFSEVPKPPTPERVERAQATNDFLKGKGANPFAGLTHEKLAAIQFDDSGAYTVNERRAAFSELATRRTNFWAPVISQAQVSGDSRGLYEAALSYYDQLTPMERALDHYPPSYKATVAVALKDEEEKHGGKLDMGANSVFMPQITAYIPPSQSNSADAKNTASEKTELSSQTPSTTDHSVDERNMTWSRIQKMIVSLGEKFSGH